MGAFHSPARAGALGARIAALAVVLLAAACAEQSPDPGLANDPHGPSGGPEAGGTPRAVPSVLRESGHFLGAEDAPVTVVEFSDFGCAYCAEFAAETFSRLRAEFIDQELVRWIFVPVASGAYPNGREAARAAICAGEQDAFWAYHDLLFTDRRGWNTLRSPAPRFATLARQSELDAARFLECYAAASTQATLDRANRAALLFGVRAYPSFLIEGRLVEGALDTRTFSALLRQSVERD